MHNTSTLHQEIEQFTQLIATELKLYELLDWLATKLEQGLTYWWNYRLRQ